MDKNKLMEAKKVIQDIRGKLDLLEKAVEKDYNNKIEKLKAMAGTKSEQDNKES